MILKMDIKKALCSKKVFEMVNEDYNAFKTFIALSIREYYTRTGQKAEGNEMFLKETISITCEDLKRHFNYLPIQEFKLSLEYGANGVFGDVKHACDATFKFYLTSYLILPIRALTLQELQAEQNKDLKLLDEHKGGEEYNHVESMRKRYRENLERVRNGSEVIDFGGLLFEHLEKLGFIKICNEDYESVTDFLIKKKKANPFDLEVRRCLSSDEIKKILARETALTNYFKMEIAMRDEYQKIKNDSSGK